MVKKLDDFAHDVPGTPLTSSRDQFAERAYSLLTSSAAQSAFRMNQESAAVREKYGRTTVGQSCLLARRLVEAGVSFVTFNDRGDRPARLGHARAEFPDDQKHAGPTARQGSGRARRRPLGTGPARQHARRDDGRIRPDAQDQPQRRPRPSRPGQLGLALRRGHSRAAWSSAGPTPAATRPPSAR